MDIQTILECLNSAAVRATYGAVGEVLGVRPQVVPRLLGARRPEASWVVNGTTGEPTGYAPEEVDPRLPDTHVIRTGDELRACLEGGAPAVPEEVPAVNAAPGPTAPEPEPFGMNSDAKWIIGTLVPVFLLVAGLLAAQIASVSRGLNTRLDEVNGRIDDLAEQVGGVDTRMDDVRTELQDEIAVLRSEVGGIAGGLSPVAPTAGGTEPDEADAGEQASESEAPEAGPDTPENSPDMPETSPEAPEAGPDALEASPDAPETDPDTQPEPPADPDAPVVTPAPPGE